MTRPPLTPLSTILGMLGCGLLGCGLLGCGLLGCGGAPAVGPTAVRALDPRPADEVAEPPAEAALSVEGLRGTLSPREVRGALRPSMPEITGCFLMRSMSFEHLGGALRMRIRLDPTGRVTLAQPEDSTVGDREVERCVAGAIAAARFPAPHGGGEAELRWSLSVQPPDEARGPATWAPERVARVVRRRARRARTACQAEEPVQITAYVSRRGRVLAAGAASTAEADAELLDCVAAQVRRWRMPAASRVTKVTFDLT